MNDEQLDAALIAHDELCTAECLTRRGHAEVLWRERRRSSASTRRARLGGEPHHFEITVRMWGDGADWDSTLVPQEMRAYNLHDALVQASERPLAAWFPDEERERADGGTP